MNKVLNLVADHSWLVLMAGYVAVSNLEPAFPHAQAALGAVSQALFQLAILAANPMAALKTLSSGTKVVEVPKSA